MLHSTSSPATTPRDSRGAVQSPYAQAALAGKRSSRTALFEGNCEPSLDELLDDEIVRRLMVRDGVRPEQVWSLMDRLRDRIR